ncbi:TIGR03086 family metal-binding protein [Embleya sp. NBC_00896]|uniref:TIGR03086 family metal-binding protein n=1 Tax=Embleya sp. NBC_00896 TaxID=2975961 RepID=UPI002F914330|nr:TIGR03086 family metal-binding protein [Embleya sp. NBC_00896]
MTATPDFESPAARIALLVQGVGDERLADPTPCAKYKVRDLLSHLVGLTAAFRDAGRKEFGPSTTTAPGPVMPDLDPDWRTVLPRQLDELVATWRKPEAWEGETQAGGITLPAEIMGLVAQNELLVHGWDLARATGQEYKVDAANLEASLALLTPAPDADAADGADEAGLFAPAVPVPADAPMLDRVVALAGRRPSWTPPS